MGSTFHGLEVAKRGMAVQQMALYTTGHNIANANTPGYSRQRVNFVQSEPYPPASMNRPQIPGQMGTGVEAGSIERVRDRFFDWQYRGENNKLGYWQAQADALKKMEDIMNEPSDSGLSKTMDQFWQALQDLSANPENTGARSVVRQRGLAVVETFHYLADSLTSIQNDLANEIQVTVKSINSIAEQLYKINQQIAEVEPHGYLPNDLYDERDRLLDELSALVKIEVEPRPSGGNALNIAEGAYDVYILDGNGQRQLLVNGTQGYRTLSVSPSASAAPETPTGPLTGLSLGGSSIPFVASGKLKGLIEAYGYDDGSGVKGIYPDMLKKLDTLAYSFAKRFNEVHQTGYTLSPSNPGGLFFTDLTQVDGAAKAIQLSSNIDDLNNIAASSAPNEPGNGFNAIRLANVKNSNFANLQDPAPSVSYPITAGTLQAYYESMIGQLAVDAQQANRLVNNSEVLRQSVEERRQSVSGVSLDEEMTNMIRFQHAYNAAARTITTIDEMLDKIINGMGIVGR